MRTDWYKGIDPNLEKLTELLSMSKPSHGYTIAENAPEVVTAPGVYFPARKGEVIPLESRQAGGNVNPTMNPTSGGMMSNTEDGKMKILASALKSIDKIVATFSPKESPMKLESRQEGGGVTSLLERIKDDPNVFTETSSMGASNPEGDIQAGKGMDALSNAMRESNLAILTPPPISLEQKEASMASSVPGLPSVPTSSSYSIQPEVTKLGENDLINQRKNKKRAWHEEANIPLFSMAEGTKEGEYVVPPEEDEYERLRKLLQVGPERRFLGGKEVTSGPMYEASEKGMSGDELAKEALRSTLSSSDVGGEMKYWEDVAKARTRQAEYDRYAADKELREAAGISPRRGMPEYEYGAKRMRMTRGEKYVEDVAKSKLAEEYFKSKGVLDVAGLKTSVPPTPHWVQDERGNWVGLVPGGVFPGVKGKTTLPSAPTRKSEDIFDNKTGLTYRQDFEWSGEKWIPVGEKRTIKGPSPDKERKSDFDKKWNLATQIASEKLTKAGATRNPTLSEIADAYRIKFGASNWADLLWGTESPSEGERPLPKF